MRFIAFFVYSFRTPLKGAFYAFNKFRKNFSKIV